MTLEQAFQQHGRRHRDEHDERENEHHDGRDGETFHARDSICPVLSQSTAALLLVLLAGGSNVLRDVLLFLTS